MNEDKILELLEKINAKLETLAADVTYNRTEIDALQRSVNSLNMLSSDSNNKIRETMDLLKK